MRTKAFIAKKVCLISYTGRVRLALPILLDIQSYFSEFMVKCEAEDGGGGHLHHEDDHHHDEVLVQASLQGGELVLGDLRVEGDLGLGASVYAAGKHVTGVLQNCPRQQQVVIGQGASLVSRDNKISNVITNDTHLRLVPLLAGPHGQPAKEAVQFGVWVLTLYTPKHGAKRGHIPGLGTTLLIIKVMIRRLLTCLVRLADTRVLRLVSPSRLAVIT